MIEISPHRREVSPQSSQRFIAKDPRFVMLAFALMIAFALFVRDTKGLVVELIYLLVLYRAADVPIKSIVQHVKTIVLFVVLIIAINAVLIKGEPLASNLRFISREGLTTGVHFGVRLLVLYLTVILFLYATPPESIAKGIAALIKPFSPSLARSAALNSFISLGFLPLFSREIQRIRVAQRFRGGGMDGGPLKKLNGVRLLLVPLILSAVQRSAQLAMVVELRDIRTTIAPLLTLDPVSRGDYLFVVLTSVILLTTWWIV
jgi:energy-coupling factor transport system permease protein